MRDLDRLLRKPRGTGRLPPAEPRGSLPAGKGVGYPGGSSEGGGGLLSPITEQSRTSHPVKVLTSSDGLFTLEVLPVKSITFEDALGDEFVMNLANPS